MNNDLNYNDGINQNNNSNKKKNNALEIGLLVLLIYYFISIVLLILIEGIKLKIVIYLYDILIVFIGFIKAHDKKTIATKYGLVIGISLLLGDIISIILGVYTIIYSVNYNKQFNGRRDKKHEWIVIPIIIIIYVTLVTIYALIDTTGIFNPKLNCTRENGDKVVYYFNNDGIAKVLVNGEEDKLEKSIANLYLSNKKKSCCIFKTYMILYSKSCEVEEYIIRF